MLPSNVFLEVSDPRMLGGVVADELVATAQFVREDKGEVNICLSGGQTPLEAYRLLTLEPRKSDFPWDAVNFFIGDERWAPRNPELLNFTAINENLFSKISNIKYFAWEGKDEKEARENFEKSLLQKNIHLNGFDILMLGLGEDGHIASLFPGSPILNDFESLTAISWDNKLKINRLTIAPKLIFNAKRIFVCIKGSSKAEIAKRLFLDDCSVSELPAKLIFKVSCPITFFMDHSAAKFIQHLIQL